MATFLSTILRHNYHLLHAMEDHLIQTSLRYVAIQTVHVQMLKLD